ncbi:hypothetical protein TSUD_175030 [Trifolium subterraneum]|uniref:Uncharacterized protein n=1 Tax=Trifolium subterraneum TaxID=3900 RepID=A0A2Z6NRR2_TRISU|nr:hypothetical protein TSUD_175030 [Trifolium subterraneum]
MSKFCKLNNQNKNSYKGSHPFYYTELPLQILTLINLYLSRDKDPWADLQFGQPRHLLKLW